MSPAQLIANAIKRRRVIQFRYKLQVRQVEPHLLGYPKGSDLTLSAWQITGTKPGWRDFPISKMTELTPTDRRFASARQGYNPNDKTMSRIVARL
jgi:predicted DNA-binding transcriptional regulator YafY